MTTAHLAYCFYPVIIAALLAAGAIWLERLTRGPDPAATETSEAPDFTADGVRITGFADDGQLRYTLDAPRVTHLPRTDTTRVDHPRLQLFSQGRRIWIEADEGEASARGERVDFSGNVEAEREAPTADETLHFSSTRLTVWPQEQRAASNVPVRIAQGLKRANANRFAADNIFGVMKLSGKVRMSLPRNRRNP